MIYLDANSQITTREKAFFARDKKNPNKFYIRTKYRIWCPWIVLLPGGILLTLKCFEFGKRFIHYKIIPSDQYDVFWGMKLHGKFLVDLVEK